MGGLLVWIGFRFVFVISALFDLQLWLSCPVLSVLVLLFGFSIVGKPGLWVCLLT